MVELLSLDEVLFQEEPRAYMYRGKSYRSVTDYLKEAGLCEDFSVVPADRMENALRRGQMVHLACQYLDEGRGVNWDLLDPRLEGYVRGHERMLEDLNPKPIAIEKPIVAPSLNVGGRPDVVYWIAGRRCLVDRKSGNSRKRRDGKVQTALYKLIWDHNHPAKKIDRRYIEKLYPTGKYQLIPCEDLMDLQAAMDVLKWGERNQKIKQWRQYYGYADYDDRSTGHNGNDGERTGALPEGAGARG